MMSLKMDRAIKIFEGVRSSILIILREPREVE